MAQNVTLWGANYPDVPSLIVPKTGGGNAQFYDVSDTTAAAADVAVGKYFYTSAGVRTEGTNSGGGGGATNLVQGKFTCGTTTGAVETVSIPYTGSGYPIAAMVFVSGGAYNSSNTTWYNSVQRYAVGQWTFSKSVQTSTPTYGTSGAANQGVTTWIYKNSTSQSTTYSRSSAMNTNVLSSSSTNATGAGATCVRFKGNGKTLTYYIASSSYGLLAGLEYQYIIVYSS